MHYTVEFVLKSYMPKQLEPGMWFIKKMNQGTVKEESEIWAIDKVPQESLESFVTQHGAPVEPYLVYNEQPIAQPHEIGWWDEGDATDELRDIELKDINLIINENDGFVDVEIDEWDFVHEDEVNPIIYANKVVMSKVGTFEDEEEEEDDYVTCESCNGTGEGFSPDTTCPVCKGDGEVPIDDN